MKITLGVGSGASVEPQKLSGAPPGWVWPGASGYASKQHASVIS